MGNSEELFHYFKIVSIFELGRYFVLVGLVYWLVYSVFKSKVQHKKIQQKAPTTSNIRHEILYSISTIFIFIVVSIGAYWLYVNGYTMMYDDISDYGIPYFIFSVVLMIILQDTYFYWAHRFMHLKSVYPIVHLVHHKSTNPTPWASYSFHPIEAIIHYVLLPVMILSFPTHFSAILIYLGFTTIENIAGHLGYEIFKEGFTSRKITRLSNTITHHNMHHSKFDCNYGLFFNVWDQLMGTNHEDYHATFEKVAKEEAPK